MKWWFPPSAAGFTSELPFVQTHLCAEEHLPSIEGGTAPLRDNKGKLEGKQNENNEPLRGGTEGASTQGSVRGDWASGCWRSGLLGSGLSGETL